MADIGVRWSVPVTGVDALVVDEYRVYVQEAVRIAGIDRDDGRVLWAHERESDGSSVLAVVGERLHLDGEDGPEVRETFEGEVVDEPWTDPRSLGARPTDRDDGAEMAAVDRFLFENTLDGLRITDSESGDLVMHVAVQGPSFDPTAPIVDGTDAFVATSDGRLWCLSLVGEGAPIDADPSAADVAVHPLRRLAAAAGLAPGDPLLDPVPHHTPERHQVERHVTDWFVHELLPALAARLGRDDDVAAYAATPTLLEPALPPDFDDAFGRAWELPVPGAEGGSPPPSEVFERMVDLALVDRAHQGSLLPGVAWIVLEAGPGEVPVGPAEAVRGSATSVLVAHAVLQALGPVMALADEALLDSVVAEAGALKDAEPLPSVAVRGATERPDWSDEPLGAMLGALDPTHPLAVLFVRLGDADADGFAAAMAQAHEDARSVVSTAYPEVLRFALRATAAGAATRYVAADPDRAGALDQVVGSARDLIGRLGGGAPPPA